MRLRAIAICSLILLMGGVSLVCLAQSEPTKKSTAEAFEDAIHYLRIARWDLAKSNLEYLALNGDPVEVLALAQKKSESEQTLLGALAVQEVAASAQKVLQVLERGRAAQQQDPALIEEEIARLGTTPRGRLLAKDRLCNIYREYAVPQLLRALADEQRGDLHASIIWILTEMGRPAVDPLTAGLVTGNSVYQRKIVTILGNLGYREAAPYLREVIEKSSTRPEVKDAASEAMTKLQGLGAAVDSPAASLFYRLANDYYYGKVSRVEQAGITTAKVWYFKADIGPTFELVPGKVYDEIMTMQCCQRALSLEPAMESAVSLWLAGALQMQAKLGEGEKVVMLGENWPGAQWFVVTAGQRYLQEVLARADKDRNAPVALGAVKGLDLTAGRAWLTDSSRIIPLADALRFPNRRVRIAAAFALAKVGPERSFAGAQAVVPTLCEAIRLAGNPRAVIMEDSSDVANALQEQLRQLGYDTQIAASWDEGLQVARNWTGPELLVVGKDGSDPRLADLLDKLADDFALADSAVVALADEENVAPATELAGKNSYVQVLPAGSSGQAVAAKHQAVLAAVHESLIAKDEADRLALTAAKLFIEAAQRQQSVFDPNPASETLIGALSDPRQELAKLALQGLSLLPYSVNQQAIARYALDDRNPMEMRLIALNNLGESARLWGNQLAQEQITALLREVLDGQPSDYHSAAARVIGALNLPSEVIKDLVTREKH